MYVPQHARGADHDHRDVALAAERDDLRAYKQFGQIA